MMITIQETQDIDQSLKFLNETEVYLDSLIAEFGQELPNDLNACL
jgi:hypothetical protein